MTVFLGAHNFTGSGIAFKGNKTVHEGYITEGYTNDELADLALIHLDRKADVTDTVKPACLVKNSSIRDDYIAAGWGLTRNGEISQFLFATKLNATKEFNRCIMPDVIPDRNKLLCLYPVEPYGDVCLGDSGGPIFGGYPGYSNCNYEVVGIVSQGYYCKRKEGGFTYHTRIDYYRNWIEDKVWGHETIN